MDKLAFLDRVRDLALRGKLGLAISELEGELHRYPDDTRFLIRLAELRERNGEHAAAVSHYVAAARIFEKQGFLARAIAILGSALRLRNDAVDVRIDLAELHRANGNIAESRAQYSRAAMMLSGREMTEEFFGTKRKAMEREPELAPRIYVQLAELQFALGQYPQSLAALKELFHVHRRDQNRKEAASVALRTLELFPKDMDAAKEVAAYRLEEGQHNEAITIIERLGPAAEDEELLTLLERGYRRLSHREKVLEVLKRLAHLFVRQGRPDAASDTWKRVADIAPDDKDLAAMRWGRPRRNSPPPLLQRHDLLDTNGLQLEDEAPAPYVHLAATPPPPGEAPPAPPDATATASVPYEDPTDFSSSKLLDHSIESKMPHPLARAWWLLPQHPEGAERAIHLRIALGTVLRFLLAIEFIDYLRGPPSPEIEALLPSLEKPSEGRRLEVLAALVAHISSRPAPKPFVPELGPWLSTGTGRPSAARNDLNSLVALRNKLHHDQGSAEVAEISAAMLKGLRRVMRSLLWLSGYRLVLSAGAKATRRGDFEGRLQVYMGHEEVPRPIRANWRGFLADGAIYLLNPETSAALDLAPFLSAIQPPALDKPRLFMVDGLPGLREIQLANPGIKGSAGLFFEVAGHRVDMKAWTARRSELRLFQEFDDFSGSLEREYGPTSDLGRTVGGRFDILHSISLGGMATVYRAVDRSTGTEVALKVVKADFSVEEELRERFRREVRTMKALVHPHVVPILDHGELPDGRQFIVMPVAGDGTLHDVIAAEKPQPLATLLRWTLQLLSALKYMHQQGVVHRDIKPANILVSNGMVLIADFGIARRESEERTLTRTAEQIGSEAYMSPEQKTPEQEVSFPTDLFSLAVVLHMLTTGSRRVPIRPGKGIPGPWGALLQAMGSPEQEERPTASQAIDALLDTARKEGARLQRGSA